MTESAYILHTLAQPSVLALLGGTIIATSAIVGACWTRIRRAELDATLKIEMVKRGLSSAEIVQVLEASARR